MTNVQKAVLWAAGILITAYLAKDMGLSSEASFALTMGLAGASWTSIAAGNRRSRSKACS